MKVLVLGGNGFIGSHVVDQLLAEGHTVRVFDRSHEKYRSSDPRVDYCLGRFDDVPALAESLEGVDVVYHLISTTVPSTSNKDPVADVESNLQGTLRLLNLIRDSSVSRLVFMSSGGTVYGIPATIPIPEDHPLRPLCSYGIVKVAIENYLHMYSVLYGLNAVILRASNPYGERQGHSGVQGIIGTVFSRILAGRPIEIWGDGSVVRDYIYAHDLASLCVVAGASDVGGVFNAGSGSGVSINELIDKIIAVSGREVEVIRTQGRAYDIPEIVLDVGKARMTFGWQAKTTLDDGLERSWRWYTSTSGSQAGGRT